MIISETVQATPIKFAVKTVRLKVHYDHCQSNDLDLHLRSQVHIKLYYFLSCNISDNAITFKLGMTVDLWMPYMLVLITLTLMLRHSGLAKAKSQRCMLSATKQAINIKLATKVGHVYVTLTLQTLYMS